MDVLPPPKWLLKTEPSEFSFAQLLEKKKVVWDGISNPQALANMRQIKLQDRLLIYHTGQETQIVGTAVCGRAAYPDPHNKDPRLVVMDIEAGEALLRPITLEQIKQVPELADWELVRQPRLSVVPISPKVWKELSKLM